MKSMKFFLNNRTVSVILIVVLSLYHFSVGIAQNPDIEKSIAANRKGELTIKAKPGAQVNVEQIAHEFWFGCAIPDGIFNGSMPKSDIDQFKDKFLKNFNSAVTENAVKWGNMERRKGEVKYSVIDSILGWTEANHIPIRGHNLFWGISEFVQSWVKELSDQELEQTLKNRAETLTARYKGRFAEYDLNNEMVHGNYYEDRLGSDITKKMAEWSRSGDPDIKLFLNDYDILTGVKLKEYLTQIRSLLKQGVPIAGIGVQGHLHAETFDHVQLKNALDSLAQFQLPIRVTEFNMPGQRSKYYKDRNLKLTAEEEEMKAKEITDYYRICFAHPAVAGMLMWGFWEGANWIPTSSLYKKDWTPTPSAIAYHNLIFKEWWTSEKGKTNGKGEFSVPAFFGKYKVTVNEKTKEVNLTKSIGKVVVEF